MFTDKHTPEQVGEIGGKLHARVNELRSDPYRSKGSLEAAEKELAHHHKAATEWAARRAKTPEHGVEIAQKMRQAHIEHSGEFMLKHGTKLKVGAALAGGAYGAHRLHQWWKKGKKPVAPKKAKESTDQAFVLCLREGFLRSVSGLTRKGRRSIVAPIINDIHVAAKSGEAKALVKQKKLRDAHARAEAAFSHLHASNTDKCFGFMVEVDNPIIRGASQVAQRVVNRVPSTTARREIRMKSGKIAVMIGGKLSHWKMPNIRASSTDACFGNMMEMFDPYRSRADIHASYANPFNPLLATGMAVGGGLAGAYVGKKLWRMRNRKSKVSEALSEKKRASLPKKAFVSKSKKREGHADKGLYPIFDAHSAKSAVKLAFHHPEMKEQIYRKAAKYGVGPKAKESTDACFGALLERKDTVCMTKKAFKKEHNHLLDVLKNGKPAELRHERKKQAKEMHEEISETKSFVDDEQGKPPKRQGFWRRNAGKFAGLADDVVLAGMKVFKSA